MLRHTIRTTTATIAVAVSLTGASALIAPVTAQASTTPHSGAQHYPPDPC
jgi:hypothetical protein